MSNTVTQPATFTWHPIDGAPVVVSLYRHPGPANQRRCVVDGKTVGYVWQRNVNGYRAVWSYRLEADTLGMVRGSCRDRDEAVSRLMWAVCAAVGAVAAGATAGVAADGIPACAISGRRAASSCDLVIARCGQMTPFVGQRRDEG